jgi:hypothetical protein
VRVLNASARAYHAYLVPADGHAGFLDGGVDAAAGRGRDSSDDEGRGERTARRKRSGG